jgi:hypothetical protein
MNLLRKIWDNIKKNAQSNQLTRRQQVFQELSQLRATWLVRSRSGG